MPAVTVDFSINLPLIVTLLVMAGTLVRLTTRLEDGLKNVREDLEAHTKFEEKSFAETRQAIHALRDGAQASATDRAVMRTRLETLEKGHPAR